MEIIIKILLALGITLISESEGLNAAKQNRDAVVQYARENGIVITDPTDM